MQQLLQLNTGQFDCFPPNGFEASLTLFSKCLSCFPHGTYSLSVSYAIYYLSSLGDHICPSWLRHYYTEAGFSPHLSPFRRPSLKLSQIMFASCTAYRFYFERCIFANEAHCSILQNLFLRTSLIIAHPVYRGLLFVGANFRK